MNENNLELIENLGNMISEEKGYKKNFGLYKCKCGNEKIFRCDVVKSGQVTDCGCFNKNRIEQRRLIPKDKVHQRLFEVWRNMKYRCESKKCKQYQSYGGRGIRICDEWKNDFMSFYNWAIKNNYNFGLQIDRIDNNGNYEPSNCQFITQSENCSVGKRRKRTDNTSGYVGVFWSYKLKKWCAQIKLKHIGVFDNLNEAIEARINAEIELFGEQCTNFHYKTTQ